MSFWKKLSRWAAKMEEQAARDKADRRISKPLNFIGLSNALHAFSGEVSKMFDVAGNLIVQHVSKCTNDLATVMRTYFEGQQKWTEDSFKLYENSLVSYLHTFNEAAEIRHKEMLQSIEGLYHQQRAMELNAHDRFLHMAESMRQMSVDNQDNHNINHGTSICLFQNLTEQIQSKQRVVVKHKPQVSLEWMLEHADEVIRFADELKRIRDNTAPAEYAIVEAVRTARSMFDGVGMLDVKEALDAKAREWDVAA